MTIQWNKVTWYSQIIAVVLFAGVFFFGLSLGSVHPEFLLGEGAMSCSISEYRNK